MYYLTRPLTIGMWRDIKSELWRSLTPKLVWASGSIAETKLGRDFCKVLDE